MDIIVIIFIIVVVLAIAGSFMRKNPKTLTDQALWWAYSRHLKRLKGILDDPGAFLKEDDRIKPIEDELKSRGYNINKLIGEEGMAKWQNRPMNFSVCRVDSKESSESSS